jgi:hypothetical protein
MGRCGSSDSLLEEGNDDEDLKSAGMEMRIWTVKREAEKSAGWVEFRGPKGGEVR